MRKPAPRSNSLSPNTRMKRRKSAAAAKPDPRKLGRCTNLPARLPALQAVHLPQPGSGKRGEHGHIAYLLRQAQAATRLTLDRSLADLGVTPPQFAVLTMLKAYPGLSGADVARLALLTPQTVGVIIGNLERGGAIRKKPHPVHGRVLQWTLTHHGSDLLEKCRRRVDAVERRLVAGLGAKAETTIRRWLSKIAADLHQDI